MSVKEQLNQMLNDGAKQDEAFAFFDQLEVVDLDSMWGLWKGEELQTGHFFEGVLTTSGWYGKRFENSEEVFPLLFEREDRTLYSINPAFIPLNVPYQKVPIRAIPLLMRLARPLVATNKSGARLRMTNYRGRTTACMVYDHKPIIDVFRKVDETTLLGVMDMKRIEAQSQAYFFVLNKIK